MKGQGGVPLRLVQCARWDPQMCALVWVLRRKCLPTNSGETCFWKVTVRQLSLCSQVLLLLLGVPLMLANASHKVGSQVVERRPLLEDPPGPQKVRYGPATDAPVAPSQLGLGAAILFGGRRILKLMRKKADSIIYGPFKQMHWVVLGLC